MYSKCAMGDPLFKNSYLLQELQRIVFGCEFFSGGSFYHFVPVIPFTWFKDFFFKEITNLGIIEIALVFVILITAEIVNNIIMQLACQKFTKLIIMVITRVGCNMYFRRPVRHIAAFWFF
jgi:hypothetical protein